ncbi:hypothetical protein [Bifidobacterium bohemicum]|nr:hypothetical protein [Bifidobacterium bohemicum]
MVFPWEVFVALGLPSVVAGMLAAFLSAKLSLNRPAIVTIQAVIGE